MIAHRHQNADLTVWAQATRTEVTDLLEAMEGRATVDRETAVAARALLYQGFDLVERALNADSHSF